jgi:hypothetical protein
VLDCPAKSRAGRIDRHDRVRPCGGCFRSLPALTAAEAIDAPIVSNSEQPRRQRTVFIERVQPSGNHREAIGKPSGSHREAIAAMDFFTLATVTFGVIYGFFIISLIAVASCTLT